MVKEVTSKNEFEREVFNYDGVVVVDFYAEWCMPCKIMAITLEEIASKLPSNVKIIKVNVDAFSELAKRYYIFSIPTLIIFCRGKEIERIVGLIDKNEIVSKIRRAASKC